MYLLVLPATICCRSGFSLLQRKKLRHKWCCYMSAAPRETLACGAIVESEWEWGRLAV